MLRLTPSLLDTFRLYQTTDWKPLSELEAYIKGEPITPSPAMLLGSAFHSIADGTAALSDGKYESGGLVFDQTTTDNALTLRGPGVAEVWCSRIIEELYPYGPLLLRGRADWISGAIPIEIKTKQDAPAPEDYAASLQWQCYLWMLGAEECRYLLVQLKEVGDCWQVVDADLLPLFRYAGMSGHLRLWASRFLQFCESRNLLPYLNKE